MYHPGYTHGYVAERQSQVDLINIPPTACATTTGRVGCVHIVLMSVRFETCDAHGRIPHWALNFVSRIEQYPTFHKLLKD
ncbi:hypothetical protein AZE42_09233 [Rhizopogon vesiculosus]|uniref:Uncharacterized protein n=1 Tax=Rhizopogon vesiculosus TaxID=180088 RepID=A0A1J8QRK7_9AGAM|nr:hypothetical protein AZE42_09233 [Rhizopogon vesiculosus]